MNPLKAATDRREGREGEGMIFFGWIGDLLKILNRTFTDNVGNPLRH